MRSSAALLVSIAVLVLTASSSAHRLLTVTITAGPSATTTETTATFEFTADVRGAAFSCSLDDAALGPCVSPIVYRGLTPGTHSFRVRTLSGRTVAEATRTWTVAGAQPTPRPPAITPVVREVVPYFDDLSIFTSPPTITPLPVSLEVVLPPAIGSKCAIVWDPLANASLYEKSPDKPCWTGSTAKIMTAHVTLDALKQGKVALEDKVTYSEKSVAQGCTCIGSYLKEKPADWDKDTDPIKIATPGERTTLEDMLYGVAMSAAQPTVSTAEYIAGVMLENTKDAAKDWDQSAAREIAFVKTLMLAHALHAGATNTTFVNEHGGDVSLDESKLPGFSKGSPRDFVRMWNHALTESSLFLQAMGLVAYEHTNYVPSVPTVVTYAFAKKYWYYPGIEGDKNGSVQPAGEPRYSSLVASGTRLGRRLIVDTEEGDGDKDVPGDATTDAAKILDYSFASVFSPVQRAASGPKGDITDQALDCTGSKICFGARSDGQKRLGVLVWDVDAQTGKAAVLSSATIGACKPSPPPKSVNEPAPPPCPPAGPPVDQVDVAYLGLVGKPPLQIASLFATADRRGKTVALRTWSFAKGLGPPARVGKDEAALMGDDVELLALSPTRFVSAIRNGTNLWLHTWELQGKGSKIVNLDSVKTKNISDVALAPSKARPSGFVTAVRISGKRRLMAWQVDAAGKITQYAASGGKANLSNLSVVELDIATFATAGTAPDGSVEIDYWRVLPDGTIQAFATMGPYLGMQTETALGRLSKNGVLLATRDGSSIRLYPFEWDARYAGWKGDPAYYRLGTAGAGLGALLDLAQLDTKKAVGDFATSVANGAGKLELRLWRVGQKP